MQAAVINQPSVNFDALLLVAVDAFGYSPAAAVDRQSRQVTEGEKFVSCLAAIGDQWAAPGWRSDLNNHVSYSVLIGGTEDEIRRATTTANGIGLRCLSRVALSGNSLGVLSGVLNDFRLLWQLEPEIEAAFRSVGVTDVA